MKGVVNIDKTWTQGGFLPGDLELSDGMKAFSEQYSIKHKANEIVSRDGVLTILEAYQVDVS